jgi:formylmethanofuran dehydrogenase subunit E
MRKFFIVSLIAVLYLSIAICPTKALDKRGFPKFARWYYKVKPIEVIDKTLIGSGSSKEPRFRILFIDVAKYHGHACIGISAGYRAAQEALKALYGKETPVRGDIVITTYTDHCPADAISYICAARKDYGRAPSFGNLKIENKDDITRYIFTRKSNKKSVEIVLKKDVIPAEFWKLRKKVMKEKNASKREIKKFRKIMQKTAKKIATARADKIFEVNKVP